jgi:hypothetical protein
MHIEPGKKSLELTEELANHIVQRLAEGGQPPELGIQFINVGNESYLSILEHEYFERILKGGSSFKLVEGYFGGGKTHFLYCVKELSWDHGFATSMVELSPNECPYDDPLKVYQAVARGLSTAPPEGRLAPMRGLTLLLENHADDLVSDNGKKMALTYLRRTLRGVPCESHSFRQAVVAYLRADIEEDDETSAVLGAWLSGEPVTAAQVRAHGVFEPMTRSNAFVMLRSLSQMITGMGMPGLVLLFDEVDRNMSVGPRRIRSIGDNLRQVIDLCGRSQLPGTLFLYAVPPEFMRNIVPEYPALHQRLRSPIPFSIRSPQAPVIDLQLLDLEPVALLEALGDRILAVFEKARGIHLDHELQARNISLLARKCVEGEFELNHRRLFVKIWTDALFRQMVDGEEDLQTRVEEDMVLKAVEDLASKTDTWKEAGNDVFADGDGKENEEDEENEENEGDEEDPDSGWEQQ